MLPPQENSLYKLKRKRKASLKPLERPEQYEHFLSTVSQGGMSVLGYLASQDRCQPLYSPF